MLLMSWILSKSDSKKQKQTSMRGSEEQFNYLYPITNGYNSQLYTVAELSKSNAIIFSNCYVMNHWFLALIQAYGYEMFNWLTQIQSKSMSYVDTALTIAYIWFSKLPRKPPDKAEMNDGFMSVTGTIATSAWNLAIELTSELCCKTTSLLMWYIEWIEDYLFMITSLNINLAYCIFISHCLVNETTKEVLNIVFGISFEREKEQGQNHFDDIWNKQVQSNVMFYDSIKSKRVSRQLRFGRKVICNYLVSLSAKSARSKINHVMQADTDCYYFGIDTCTSYHICKEKDLFVGEIKKCRNVYIQGVGGKTAVSGYGTIKLRVTDDEGNLHDLQIHEVLYVPSSPANLISPQQWSQSCAHPEGTGELTVGDATLLFWNERRFSKLIPHHPEMKIPIMSVNDGYTKCQAMMTFGKLATMYDPIITTEMQTSQVVQDAQQRLHVIPVDDNEDSIHAIPGYDHVRVEKMKAPILIESDESESEEESTSFENDKFLAEDDDFEIFVEDEDSVQSDLNDDSEIEKTSEISQNELDKLAEDLKNTVTEDQRELMSWHLKLKHMPFSDIKRLAERGVLPRRLAKVKPPLCHSCLMGKQHRRPWKGRGKNKRSIRQANETFPGANTSTDQMISPFGGMIPQMRGRLMRAKYYAATIFVDHFTDFTYVHLMQDTTAESTLEAKNAYESLLSSFGHKVRKYHADNGRYAEHAFTQDIRDKNQQISFCGVGSHHQNGIAERRIKSLGEDATAMLAHGQHLWPEVVSKKLWPFAYKAACRARNKFKLDSNGYSPEEKMSGIKKDPILRNEHPLFCPVYALDRRLQGGIGGLPKWNPKSNAGVYLGHSPEHSSDVALVLNLNTGLVSPQFHVVFDDTFSTVEFLRSKVEPSNWEKLCKFHSEDYRMDGPDPEETIQQEVNRQMVLNEPPPIPSEERLSEESQPQEGEVEQAPLIEDNEFDIQVEEPQTDPMETTPEGATAIEEPNETSEPEPDSRPKRRRKATSRMLDSTNASLRQAMGLIIALFISIPDGPKMVYMSFKAGIEGKLKSFEEKAMFYDSAVEMNIDGSYNYIHPFAFATQTAGNEVYYFHQAMQQEDRMQFIEAMRKELQDFKDGNIWTVVRRDEIGDAKPIKAIWSFKRKRRPDGSLLKHKARLCAHGGMQVYGENYWDTYAPVVQWVSIRMMLTLSVIHSLHTTSIDFVLAFPQAEIETTIYLELPLGCNVPEGDYVCKLNKNLYGIRQASRTWFEHLRDSLVKSEEEDGYGFTQSLIDPCIFYKEGITLIVWVDDCLIFSKDKRTADELIQGMHNQFVLTEDEDVSAYLGVQMKLDPETDKVEMTQPFLIQKIIDLLGESIRDANIKDTPAVHKEFLHKDEDGPERKQTWNYRSAIGMLNYLAATTRPDCLFAVHQCARFAANPRLSHERALKRIVRYLKGTSKKGIILTPDTSKGVQCYVDADFAGGYANDTKDEPISVFSRTGYVIFYLGCPVIWVSKLQTEISLSTVEAEYVALSQAMRDIIPMQDQMRELNGIFGDKDTKPTVHCTLFEDNNGALELAKAPRYRPRTKHIAIKYHHFREHVKNGSISINAIDTKEQIADQFTKGLQPAVFEYLRKKLLGW